MSPSKRELAELLDFTRVKPGGTAFKRELTLSLEVIQTQLAWRKAEQGAEAQGVRP